MKPLAGAFIFVGHAADFTAGQLTFRYRVKQPGSVVDFTESLSFRNDKGLAASPDDLSPIVETLYLLSGMSYWKLWCPSTIETPTLSLTENQAVFLNTVYTKGLGEFFYKNNIDFRGLVKFPVSPTAKLARQNFPRVNGSLLLVGAGKDSITTAELLRQAHQPWTNFVLNPKPLHQNVIAQTSGETISFQRTIDPQIFELEKTDGVFGGHVPISVLYTFTAILAAALHGYKYIIASNEHSANFGNVEYLGETMNHQWSKSLGFERLCQDYIHTALSPDITYFSLLRPFHEIAIVAAFAKAPKYFSVFSSCNRNFQIRKAAPSTRWCGECPKCAFVFALLAAFLPKATVVQIFVKNLFEDEKLLPTYRALLGLDDIKPFECVGTPQEAALAFLLASKKDHYADTPAMRMFENEAKNRFPDMATLKSEVFTPSSEHLIPKEFLDVANGLKTNILAN